MQLSDGLMLPVVDIDKCIECLLCLRCCPGFSLDFVRMNDEVFGKQPEDVFLGGLVECYVGHSTDPRMRSACSSGGVVGQLLVYALENRVIDGVVVVRMREDDPLRPEPFVARTREEVLTGSRAKYCPVAPNVVLDTLMAEKGRFAVVGLPCHIHGIRKAEGVFKSLKDKIVLHVGLFCGHTIDFRATGLLLRKLHVHEDEVARLNYRGNGWPDSMRIELKDGRSVRLRFNRGWYAYWNVFSPFFFTPLRCMMCPDQFNELSDVSVGDAWLPEFRRKVSGESVIVARTEVAADLLIGMEERGLLSLKPVSSGKVKESQAFGLNYKKQNLSSRLSFFRRFGRNVPRILPEPRPSVVPAYAGAFLSCVSLYFSSHKRLRSLLQYVPLPLFRLYFGLFKSVFLLSGQGRC